MAEELSISAEEIETLSGKLDAIGEQLTDKEKAVLLLAFKLAGDEVNGQIEAEGEVEGFAVSSRQFFVARGARLPSLASGFQTAFTPGGARGIGSASDDKTTVSGGINVMGTSSAGRFGGAQF